MTIQKMHPNTLDDLGKHGEIYILEIYIEMIIYILDHTIEIALDRELTRNLHNCAFSSYDFPIVLRSTRSTNYSE